MTSLVLIGIVLIGVQQLLTKEGALIEEKQSALSACEKIGWPTVKTECQALILKDEKKCDEILKMFPQGDRIYCYYYLAGIKKDVSVCEGLEESARYGCVAIANSTIEWCKVASSPVGDTRCYYWLAAFTKNSTICDHLGGYFSNVCKAVIERNPTYCEKIGGETTEECFYVMAMLNEDAALCKKVKNEQACMNLVNKDVTKVSCFLDLPDADICGLIPLLKKDASLCRRFDTMSEEMCNFYVAMRITDALPLELVYLDASYEYVT